MRTAVKRMFTCTGRRAALLACVIAAAVTPAGAAAEAPIDVLSLGQEASERAHRVTATRAETVRGGMDEPARILLPLEPQSWEGGKLSFTMKVDPAKANYVTVRLWGSDANPNRLFLFCDGKQVGYRHLGDIDQLDIGTDGPFCNGRFYYNTSPLPVESTRGKTEVQLEIRSTGQIWGYGSTFEQYQKPMTVATRGLYRVYTHTDGAFVPPAEEKQGVAPANPPVRARPGEEVLEAVKERVNREVDGRMRSANPLTQMQMEFLARAYHVKWTRAYQKQEAADQLLKSLDGIYRAYRANPKLAQADPATYNPEWFGLGPSGHVIALMKEPLKAKWDETIDDGQGGKVTRRAGFTEMLTVCRDWHTRHRRMYTNQSMINDLYGIYLANKGVAALSPEKAMPEETCRRYLYESIGLQPWLGSDTDSGPSRSAGEHFLQLTSKGLTKELGYVGNYGEVIDWVTAIYDATRPAVGEPGDEKIKAQLVRIAKARAAFRYPALDAQGNRAMRLQTVIGWRDTHFPGDVTYAQRPSWDGSPLDVVATTLDPSLVGYAQQMLADNQLFSVLEKALGDRNFRQTAGMLGVPEAYGLIKAQPPTGIRLPMAGGEYVFTDEENGVVAVRHGDEIFYASLYWRARYAINFLARVHHITPRYETIAVVRQEEEFEPSGLTYTRPNWTNFAFGNGGLKYPGDWQSAHAGEKLPIAKVPEGVRFRPGDENGYAGRALFYRLRHGNYLIGMNASKDRTYEVVAPAAALELVSKQRVPAGTVKVAPGTTVILYLGS